MNIIFKSNRLRKVCNERDRARRQYGRQMGDLLMKRLDELRAADNLEITRSLPQARCHELTGYQKGQLSVNLRFPYRLIFVPADNPIPKLPDGGLDWGGVKSIKIIGVEDTHDKKNPK